MWGTLPKVGIGRVLTERHCRDSQNELEPCILWQSHVGKDPQVSFNSFENTLATLLFIHTKIWKLKGIQRIILFPPIGNNYYYCFGESCSSHRFLNLVCIRLVCRNYNCHFLVCVRVHIFISVYLCVCGVHAHVCVHASGSQRLMLGVLFGHSTFSFICLSLCVSCVVMCVL